MGADTGIADVLKRLDRLEAEVAAQGVLLRGAPGHAEADGSGSSGGVESWGGSRGFFGGGVGGIGERYGYLLRAEWWFTLGGVSLLLLGLAFLFKLSVDEGWVTPVVRVMFGVGVGVLLVGLGIRVHGRRIVVGQAMIGGGIAALYASGYAAYTLYSLVPAAVVFPFMVGVTALAFSLSIRQDAATLSVIGVVGGLATPFLLYDGEGSTVGLVAYTCLVLSGAVAVYLYRGWRVLLAPASCGAVIVLLVAVLNLWRPDETATTILVLLAGIAYCWLAVWSAPVLRSFLLRLRRPAKPTPLAHIAAILALSIASAGLFGDVAGTSFAETGLLMAGVAVMCAAAAAGLRRSPRFRDGRTVYAQGAAAVGLGTLALAMTLDPWMLVVAVALEAVGLHILARRTVSMEDALARAAGHGIFVVLGLWFVLETAVSGTLAFGEGAARASMLAAFLFGIAAASFLGLRLLEGTRKAVYALAAHVALLWWLFIAISPLPNGDVWTTVAWGAWGAVSLILSLRTDAALAFKVAISTLALVVCKLFVVDLFWVEALYRVSLLIGFGGLFLILGYYLRSVWKPRLDTRDAKTISGQHDVQEG